jgi:hypothetical protein
MPFYPILSAPGCIGMTTISNFSPNNWEFKSRGKRYINVSWAENGVWHSQPLRQLEYGETHVVSQEDIAAFTTADSLPVLSLDIEARSCQNNILQNAPSLTHLPEWRATLGLKSALGFTSYQGEISPFPVPGSLLTFSSFMQYGNKVENFLLFLNLEKNPAVRYAKLEIYLAAEPGKLLNSFDIKNNTVNVIRLDDLGIAENDLPVVIAREMSGIPLYFSKTRDGQHLSLEHTHPPASSVIHGKRWDAQKLLKAAWFSRLGS